MAFYNSGRRIVYTNQVPFEADVLATNDYIMSAAGGLADTILGFGISEATTVRGLACTPISPPGMSVVVGPGVMYSYEDYDATNFGVIPADTDANHKLYKQAFNWDPVNLALTAPPTPGDSVIYLIEGIFDTLDVNNVSRPYFNSDYPATPIFNTNYDTRYDKIVFQAKQGTPGVSPTPPTPDAGYTGLYYVTVANGQTSIISGNIEKISTVEGQPFITESLTQKASLSAKFSQVTFTPTGSQTVSPNTEAKVLFNSIASDDLGWWDPANHRFNPNISGWFELSASIRALLVTPNTAYRISIYKNGALVKIIANNIYPVAANMLLPGYSINLFANGSSDYFELFFGNEDPTNPIDIGGDIGGLGTIDNTFQIQFFGT